MSARWRRAPPLALAALALAGAAAARADTTPTHRGEYGSAVAAGGTLAVDGRAVKLASLHGQAEAGHIDVPNDPRFDAGYEYLAAPTSDSSHHPPAPYTYLDFNSYSLHSGSAGILDSYYRQTASD